MSKWKTLCFVFIGLMLMSGLLIAQAPTSKIIGRVTDEEGAPLPGVAVVAQGPKLVGTASSITDETGTYRLFSLPAGTYTITFTLAGFNTLVRKEIIVDVSQTVTLNAAMKLKTLEEEVTVVGQSPLIDVKSTVKSQTMTKDVFSILPKGRSFEALVSVIPGVQYDAVAGGVSVDGATGAENMWFIDGTDITNIHIGTQNQSAVYEFVDEVKVTASGYEAEFGGSLGGVVNVVTRSGGNEYHGDLIGYYNDSSKLMRWHDRDYLRINPTNDDLAEYANNQDMYGRDPERRFEGVFSLGGYILKDRLWFYGSFNPVYNWFKAMRNFKTDVNYPVKYPYYQENDNFNYMAKLTAQPIKNMRVSVSAVNNFSKYRGAIPDITGASSPTYDWAREGFDYPNRSANATVDYSVGNNLLINARGGYFHVDQTNQQLFMPTTRWTFNRTIDYATYTEIPASWRTTWDRVRGWTNWSGATREMKSQIREKYSANIDLTYYMSFFGEHAWKFGFQYIRLHENYDNAVQHPLVGLNWGLFYMMPNGTRVQGRYGYYDIRSSWTSIYGYNWNIFSNQYAIYLQDSWTFLNRWTLNLGLRTEEEYIPSLETVDPKYKDRKPIHFHFGDKIAPRVGLVYDIFGDSSLKVYADFGIYYDVMKLYMAEGAYGGFKWVTDYYSFTDYNWFNIGANGDIHDRASQEACGTYMGTRNWRTNSWDYTQPQMGSNEMKPMSQSELSFGLDKKLLEDMHFSVRVVKKHLRWTLEDVGYVDTQGSEQYLICNPGSKYSQTVQRGGRLESLPDDVWPTPKAKREYWGVNVGLEKRFSKNWQGGINYTWSRVTGNYGGSASPDEFTAGAIARVSPNVERYFDGWFLQYDIHGDPIDGPLPQDRTHYFKVYGSYAFPFGLNAGVVLYGRSGRPISDELAFRDMQGYYPENRANKGRLPFQVWGDFYAEYNIRIANRYTLNFNLNFYNFANSKTAQRQYQIMNRVSMYPSDREILDKSFDYKSQIANYDPDPRYGMKYDFYGAPWMRFGVRFSF